MRNNILKLVLVLSLLLNASMLASAGYTHYKQSRYQAFPMGGIHSPGDEVRAHIFEELSLKPDQQTLMRRKANAFHADLEKKRDEINGKRAYLLNLMRADLPDTKAIQATISEISQAQEEMQRVIVAHMLEFKSILDNDQQKKFFDLIKNVMTGKKGLPCA